MRLIGPVAAAPVLSPSCPCPASAFPMPVHPLAPDPPQPVRQGVRVPRGRSHHPSAPFLLPDLVSLPTHLFWGLKLGLGCLYHHPWACEIGVSPRPSRFGTLASFWRVWYIKTSSLAFLIPSCLKERPLSWFWSLEAQLPAWALDSLLLPTCSQTPRVLFPDNSLLVSLLQTPQKLILIIFFSTLFLCRFSFPSPYFCLSLFLKRAAGIPCFEKYFPEDLCLMKVYNIWNSDNVFKIMMVTLIAIVTVASNYYVFYTWGTVLRTLYTSANLILTGALERSIIILPSLQSRKLRLREVQWLAQGHTAKSGDRAPAQPCWIPNSKFQPSCLPHCTS